MRCYFSTNLMVAVLNSFYRRSGCVQRKSVKLSFLEKSLNQLSTPKQWIFYGCGTSTLFGLGFFCQPIKTGGQNAPPPDFSISSQMTMKLGKDILWGEIFVN